MLRPKAEGLRAALMWWHKSGSTGAFTEPVEVPSKDPTSPYNMVLKHRSPREGSLLMGYWATMLILQECLNQCYTEPTMLFTDNQELANNILRSLEDVGRGLMGPHRIGYPLVAACDFVDEPTQTWALSMISRYNDTYASLSADAYSVNPAKLASDHLSASQVQPPVESQPFS